MSPRLRSIVVDSCRLEWSPGKNVKCRESNALRHKLRAVNDLEKRRSTGSNPCLTAS